VWLVDVLYGTDRSEFGDQLVKLFSIKCGVSPGNAIGCDELLGLGHQVYEVLVGVTALSQLIEIKLVLDVQGDVPGLVVGPAVEGGCLSGSGHQLVWVADVRIIADQLAECK